MNKKLTLDGADYELVQLYTIAGCAEGVPIIFLNGKMFAAKVVERKSEEKKEWEVLSFDYNGGFKYNSRGDGRFIMEDSLIPSMSTPLFEVPKSARILSVKRLTDGEVFSIGDYVNMINAHKITRIIIGGAPQNPKQDESLVWLSTSPDPYHHGVDLMVATKYKQKPIFKTHDGVGYFEGQEFEYVFAVLTKGTWETKELNIRMALPTYNSSWLYFSTTDERNKFIVENKPTLSLNEVLKWVKDSGTVVQPFNKRTLIDRVESKLK